MDSNEARLGCRFLFSAPKYGNQEPDAHDDIHDIPDRSPKTYFNQGLEQDRQSKVEDHLGFIFLLTRLIGQESEAYHGREPDELEEAVRHVEETEEEEEGEGDFDNLIHINRGMLVSAYNPGDLLHLRINQNSDHNL